MTPTKTPSFSGIWDPEKKKEEKNMRREGQTLYFDKYHSFSLFKDKYHFFIPFYLPLYFDINNFIFLVLHSISSYSHARKKIIPRHSV